MQSTLAAYKRYADGKRAVVICSHVAAAQHVAEKFEKNGIAAGVIHRGVPRATRDELVRKFNAGEIKILSGACTLVRFELGIEADAVIDMRQTLNAEKPDSIVIDMARNTHRHGIPAEFRVRFFVPGFDLL